MSTLDSYALTFEDLPRNTRKGGKDIVKTMSKTTATPEVKTGKKYAKTRGEHYKDIVITALIVAIIAFVAGMAFQNKQQDAINQAMKSVAPSAVAQEPVKK